MGNACRPPQAFPSTRPSTCCSVCERSANGEGQADDAHQSPDAKSEGGEVYELALLRRSSSEPLDCPLSHKLLCFGDGDSFENRRVEAGGSSAQRDPAAVLLKNPPRPVLAGERGLHIEAPEEAVGDDSCEGPCEEEKIQTGESVYLHLYDLSDTFAHLNAVALDLLGLGGALHVGVEVLGNEWSFGMRGVSVSVPRNHRYYSYRQTVPMGRTPLDRKEVEDAILSMKADWSGKDYDIFTRNCGTFCNALCERLGVGCMPKWVTRLAETLSKMPAVRTLSDLVARATIVDGLSPHDGSPSAASTYFGLSPTHVKAISDLEDEELLSAAQLKRGGRMSHLGFRLPSPTSALLPAASPVRCRLAASPCASPGCGCSRPLPRQRCEAFRVDHNQVAGVPPAAATGPAAQPPAPVWPSPPWPGPRRLGPSPTGEAATSIACDSLAPEDRMSTERYGSRCKGGRPLRSQRQVLAGGG